MPTRQQLDEICSDIPMYIADEEGHKSLVNTLSLVNAGIMAADGTVLKKEIRGGEIVFGSDGTPTGFLKEQAGTYTRSFLDNDRIFSVDLAKETLQDIQKLLLSEGYTMYVDGWGNYFYNESYFKAANEMDKAGNLHLMLGLTYELESRMDIEKNLEKSLEVQKYASEHVKTNWVKLFMDGTVETGTGFIEPLYRDGKQGISNWEEDEMRNTLVHVYGVIPSDYKRMAEHNIYVTEGMLWHHNSEDVRNFLLLQVNGASKTENLGGRKNS